MKFFALLLVVTVLTAQELEYEHSTSRLKLALFSDVELTKLYNEYKDKHNHCRSRKEHAARKILFKSEIREIIRLRSDPSITWRAGINVMADMTEEEIELMKGIHGNSSTSQNQHHELPLRNSRERSMQLNMPVEFDEWRINHMVGPVRFQTKSSCWANSAVVPMETQIAHLSGKFRELSVQELYDCVYPPEYDIQTTGGLVTDAWAYVQRVGRLGLAEEFPETHLKRRHTCGRYSGSTNAMEGFQLQKWYKVRTDSDLFEHVAAVSPITVSMDTKGAGIWFKVYRGGLFTAAGCGKTPDHGMVVVGYTRAAIIIKNSWGSYWGDNGYVYWDRTGDKCCMLDDAFFPILEAEKVKEV